MSTPRILVVDDEPGMLRAVERVLAADYTVACCRTPREALAMAREFAPDVALLDIRMPGSRGPPDRRRRRSRRFSGDAHRCGQVRLRCIPRRALRAAGGGAAHVGRHPRLRALAIPHTLLRRPRPTPPHARLCRRRPP